MIAVLATAAFTPANIALAAGAATPAPAQVTGVYIENGIPYISASTPFANPDGCAGMHVVTLPTDLPNQQAYLSLAMTALATGRKVTIWVNGCGWAPWAAAPNVPKVYSMGIVP